MKKKVTIHQESSPSFWEESTFCRNLGLGSRENVLGERKTWDMASALAR